MSDGVLLAMSWVMMYLWGLFFFEFFWIIGWKPMPRGIGILPMV
jgi:hypothetical protein